MARQQPGQPLPASGIQRRLLQPALIERDGRQSMFSQGQYERRFDALDSQTLIRQIHAVADGLLAGEAVPSGHYSAIFDTNALASLFGCFQAALSGKWAQQDQPLARQAGPVGGLPLAHPGEPGLYAGRHAHQGLRWRGCPTGICS